MARVPIKFPAGALLSLGRAFLTRDLMTSWDEARARNLMHSAAVVEANPDPGRRQTGEDRRGMKMQLEILRQDGPGRWKGIFRTR